jgi:cytochrome c-type biogenesis protein CcmH
VTFALFGLLAVAALVFLFSPLAFKSRTESRELFLNPYRRQLSELEKEKDRGVIDKAEADVIRLEIERRLIREGRAQQDVSIEPEARQATVIPVVVLVLVVSAAALFYAWLGRPDLPGAAAGGSDQLQQQARAELGDLAQMLAGLRANLKEDPDDVEGWLLLARSSLSMGRYEEAVSAFGRAAELRVGDAEIYVQQGQALVGLHGGTITPAASLAFARAFELQPNHPAPHLYEGYRYLQAGNAKAALAIWQLLVNRAPVEAPWLARIRMEISRAEAIVAQQESLLKGPQVPALESNEIEAAGELSPGERQAFIESMVERLRARLKAQPDDLDGWFRLARAEEVLGNIEAAVTALDRAADLAGPGNEIDIAAWRARLATDIPGD